MGAQTYRVDLVQSDGRKVNIIVEIDVDHDNDEFLGVDDIGSLAREVAEEVDFKLKDIFEV